MNYDKKQILKYIKETALPECSSGNKQYLGILQRVFAYEDEKELQGRAASVNEKILSDISVRELAWLSENFRNIPWNLCYDAYSGALWNTDFNRAHFAHLSDDQYDAMIKLGTFMPNGYGRQDCMKRLGNTQGALPFILLRMNDWVELIREGAYTMAKERIKECSLYELLCALPILEKVEHACRRSEDRLQSLKDQIGCVIGQKFCTAGLEELRAVFRCDSFVQNAICRFVNRNKVLEQDQMERLLSLEKAGYGKKLLILGIFRHYGYNREKLEEYLASKSAIVRYHALLYRFEQEQNAWEGLDKMLLDPSKRIREYAAYILAKYQNVDIIEYYAKELQNQVSKTVLFGIGENGTHRELALVIPFLESKDERISKAALTAYGRLAAESGNEVYWRFLSGSGPVMARQAYRLICKYQISYNTQDVYRSFEQNRGSALGDCFLKLLLRAPSWQRLPYLLQLYCDAQLSDEWKCLILEKMCYRNPYAKISGQQAQEISSILKQCGPLIPQRLSEGIRFDLRYVAK